jgi:hypothetical protein
MAPPAPQPPQVAQDTKALSRHAHTGAATFCFIQAIEKWGVRQTYGQLLQHMDETLKRTTTGAGASGGGGLGMAGLLGGMLLGAPMLALAGGAGMMMGGGDYQCPVMCCDRQIDMDRTQINI